MSTARATGVAMELPCKLANWRPTETRFAKSRHQSFFIGPRQRNHCRDQVTIAEIALPWVSKTYRFDSELVRFSEQMPVKGCIRYPR